MLECPVKILYTELRFFHRGEDGSRYQGEETLIADAERSRGDEAHYFHHLINVILYYNNDESKI